MLRFWLLGKENWNLLSFSQQIQHLQYHAVKDEQPKFSNFDDSICKFAMVSNPTFQKRLFRTFEIIIVKNFDDLSHDILHKFNIFVCEGLTENQKYLLSSYGNCTKVTSAGYAHQFNLIWDGIDTVSSLTRIPEVS